MYDQMKIDHVMTANESKVFRGLREKYKRKQRSYKGNYPIWAERMKEADQHRSELRVASRYLGLARAFLKNKHYRSVENKTREGNEVDPAILITCLECYGYSPEEHYIDRWLAA